MTMGVCGSGKKGKSALMALLMLNAMGENLYGDLLPAKPLENHKNCHTCIIKNDKTMQEYCAKCSKE